MLALGGPTLLLVILQVDTLDRLAEFSLISGRERSLNLLIDV